MVQVFGHISIQPDWTIDVANALESMTASAGKGNTGGSGKFWVSAYRQGEPSVHGHIQVTKSVAADGSTLVNYSVTDGSDIAAEFVNARQLRLSSRSVLESATVLYTAPRTTVACTQVGRGSGVLCFDVSPFGGLAVVGGDDGVLDVYDTRSNRHRAQLAGHVGDLTSSVFFPSGQVVLSGASDMRLRVWSASDGTNPTTLTGHTSAITDTAIVGVGKNILSAGKDGTMRLWNCAHASTLHTFSLSAMPLNAIHLVARPGSPEPTDMPPNEFETAGKLVAVACEDGRALLVDLRLRTVTAYGAINDAPVRAVAYDPVAGRLFSGRADGVVDVWLTSDTHPSAPVYSFKRNNSPISVLRLVLRAEGLPLLCVATEDGQLFLVAVTITGSTVSAEVVEELVAFDVDPITQVRVVPSDAPAAARQSIWASGRSANIYEF